jgi:hypothetical protein
MLTIHAVTQSCGVLRAVPLVVLLEIGADSPQTDTAKLAYTFHHMALIPLFVVRNT